MYGFIKRTEKSLALKAIPTEIYDIFLAFYYFGEYFDKARDDWFKISDDKLTITSTEHCDYSNHTIYMKQIFHSLSNEIIEWTFKINELKDVLFFGVTNANCNKNLCRDYGMNDTPNYGISEDSEVYANGSGYFASDHNTESPDKFKTGSIVRFTLDLKNGVILFKVDDGNNATVVKDIKQGMGVVYIFVLQLYKKDDSVTLTNFAVTH